MSRSAQLVIRKIRYAVEFVAVLSAFIFAAAVPTVFYYWLFTSMNHT